MHGPLHPSHRFSQCPPVLYLDLVHSIKGLARKPTPRRVRPGDHARKELLPYLAHLPTIFSLPLQKHLRLRPATGPPFPSWSSCVN